jgi:hypothetical protein
MLTRKSAIRIKSEAVQNLVPTFADTDFYWVENIKIKPTVDRLPRNYYRSTLGSVPSLAGKRVYDLTFSSEVKGSGTPGTPFPPLDALLQAMACKPTIHSGVEAIGDAVPRGGNLGVSPNPVIAIGTPDFSAKSGKITLTLISKAETQPEGAVFQAIFQPSDGSAALIDTATISDTDFAGVAFAGDLAALELTVDDPDGNGVGDPVSTWHIGDQWTFVYTSADQVDVTYDETSDPASANFFTPGKSCAIEAYIGAGKTDYGHLHTLAGCVATAKLSGEAAKIVMLDWTIRGLYSAPIDALMPTETPNELTAPILVSSGLTIQGLEAIASKIELDFGRQIAERVDTRSATGLLGLEITGKDPIGSIDPEMPLLSEHDFFAKLLSNEEGLLQFGLDGGVGNKVTAKAPKAQYTDVTYGDRNGRVTGEIPLQLNEDDGDDSVQLIFE